MKMPPISLVCNRLLGFYAGFLPARRWRRLLSWPLFARRGHACQLLVDVSIIIRHDAHTGIQRVVRGVLRHILDNPPPGFRVRPVFATHRRGYRYAPEGFLEKNVGSISGGRLRVQAGDVFIGLDHAMEQFSLHQAQLMWMKMQGVKIHVLVHDLLPSQRPEWFTRRLVRQYGRWIRAVARVADGAICVSGCTRAALAARLEDGFGLGADAFPVRTVPLGADIENSVPTKGVPAGGASLIEEMQKKGAVLMVGTIEPRKGYAQALAAFEKLWEGGGQEMLVIVGKPGWNTQALQKTLRFHHESGKRLFWLEGISDEYLVMLYRAARGLLMASKGEGFGLPLVEANRHGVHVLARDLPIFREVMGAAATYFSESEPEALAQAIRHWLENVRHAAPPCAGPLCGVTWRQTAQSLLGCLSLQTAGDGEVFDFLQQPKIQVME